MFVLDSKNEMVNPELLKKAGWTIDQSRQWLMVGGVIHDGVYKQGSMTLHVRSEVLNCDMSEVDMFAISHYKLSLGDQVISYTRNPVTIRSVIASIKAFGDQGV